MDLALELSPETFTYIRLGYIVGGVLCLALAAIGFGQSAGSRVINALIGVACLGYAVYLYVSDPTTVWVFPYILLLPVIVLFQAISNGVKGRREQDA
ncbi:MAG TPA: hypothetical protein VFZ32_16690 [Micromonosporaceae bacterium]